MKLVIENSMDRVKANLLINLVQMFANETINDIVKSIQESEKKPVVKENEKE